MQRDATNRLSVHLEHKEILGLTLDLGAGAFEQFLAGDRFCDEAMDHRGILFARLANGLIFIGVDKRTDPFVGENLRKEALLNPAINDVNPWDAPFDGPQGLLQLGKDLRGKFTLPFFGERGGFFLGELP